MPMQNDISVKLYQVIKNSNVKRKMEMWHASSLASCPRNQYFKRKGIKPTQEPSAALVIRWGAGHLLETMIRPHIETVYGKAATNDRMTSEKYQLTGEFDNLIEADKRLVEIKSVHDMAFIERDGKTYLKESTGTREWGNKTQKTWGAKETPYLHHELQNHCYVLLLSELGVEVKEIDYVYISLSGRIVVYSTKVSEELMRNVKARLKVLNDAWEAQVPPDCMCHLTEHPLYDSVLKYCDYRTEDGCCSLELLNKEQ